MGLMVKVMVVGLAKCVCFFHFLGTTLSMVRPLFCVQANYGLKDYECAVADFTSVLQIDPENKSARQQLVVASNRVREQRLKERQMYTGMFDRLAKMDGPKVRLPGVACWVAGRGGLVVERPPAV